MKYLISLPPNAVKGFHEYTGLPMEAWFASSDPRTGFLGSGGGTVHLLLQAYLEETKGLCLKNGRNRLGMRSWLASQKRILIHSGGQSRRLPAYSASGKTLIPMPILRWGKGQRLDQTLLNLQLPLLDKILDALPNGMNTLIASGDVLIRSTGRMPKIPNKDIVTFGHWVNPELASSHGVFFCDRFGKNEFQFMLQKPTPLQIRELLPDFLFMIDVGIWAVSDKVINDLFNRMGISTESSYTSLESSARDLKYYDLYGSFGLHMGANPKIARAIWTKDFNHSSAVLPLPNGEFYHFGTSRELISSNVQLQNRVKDQREIIHRQIKPHPAIFIQNSITKIIFTSANDNIWIENSYLGPQWEIHKNHIITGVPPNNWNIKLPANTCIDFLPIEDDKWCIRKYDFHHSSSVDEQKLYNFPVWYERDLSEDLINFAINNPISQSDKYLEHRDKSGRNVPVNFFSSLDLLNVTNLDRLFNQRKKNQIQILPALAKNFRHSIIYQLDLEALALDWKSGGFELPCELPSNTPELTRIHDQMFRAQVKRNMGKDYSKEDDWAFALLRHSMIIGLKMSPAVPQISMHPDQVVWGRSPVRLDLAGGWTDTPPNCIFNGGKVVNVAVELNGQAPLQVFIKPTKKTLITLRSIDLGLHKEIRSFEELENYCEEGCAFSIPKAALILAGIGRDNAKIGGFLTLERVLEKLGGGLELSMLVAVPKGSGLGTSSILASTVLGSLSNFYGLGWELAEIGRRTLAIEQMLTTGGGWQDQYGGIYPGLKMLETLPGFNQVPEVSWLPGSYFLQPEMRNCMLLYYTGITRVAKNILGEIVRGMFLNSNARLQIIEELGQHADELKDNILKQNWKEFGNLINKSWRLNQALDIGTNPPEIQSIIERIEELIIGQKLLGAGGGGYMFIVAKDHGSVAKIRNILEASPPNDRARFVDFRISEDGMVVTRS
jgi:galactokinase/mevalonate kinase-like predicted kinase